MISLQVAPALCISPECAPTSTDVGNEQRYASVRLVHHGSWHPHNSSYSSEQTPGAIDVPHDIETANHKKDGVRGESALDGSPNERNFRVTATFCSFCHASSSDGLLLTMLHCAARKRVLTCMAWCRLRLHLLYHEFNAGRVCCSRWGWHGLVQEEI